MKKPNNATINNHALLVSMHTTTNENDLYDLQTPVLVSNSDKYNKMLSLIEVQTLLQTLTIGTKCKVFKDSKNYAGIGIKCNAFSVNVKKTKYNVYCNDTCFDILCTGSFTGVTFNRNGNAGDHTRPHYIECKNTGALVDMVQIILKSVYMVATDTN